MSEVGDIHHLPAIRPVRPTDAGTERRHVSDHPERDKKRQRPPQPDDDDEAHIDEYA